MRAALAVAAEPQAPLRALRVAELDPGLLDVPQDWVPVSVRAAALNQHDVWSLRGVGLASERLPMVLGCDAAGVDPQGREVLVHAVINDPGYAGPDLTADPGRSLLSERYPGTLAATVFAPVANLVPKPPELSFAEAACLPTAWLTAYRMLFVRSGLRPGQTVLVQGAGGGVSTAAVALAAAAGLRVWVTSRDETRGARAVVLGAERAFAAGERLPERVDVVLESVGAATWSHSVNSLRPGGRVVVCGATTGEPDRMELTKIFFKPLSVVGSVMGTADELADLAAMLVATGVRPVIDRVLPLDAVADGLAALVDGSVFGKVVVEPTA